MPQNKQKDKLLVFAVFALGIFLRCFMLTQLPAGLHQDEAFAGYEAWCLLNYGTDSHGYINPVYFISWGSGMNALYSYMSIPFVALFGLVPLATRLPQCIFGCLSLIVFYAILKKTNEKMALSGLLLLAINPWHIMMSRWGLESNLVVFFILLGVLAVMQVFDGHDWWALVAGLSFGLALYCYAIVWVVIPLLLIAMFVYGLRHGRIKPSWPLAFGILLLFIMAVPLMLFLAVNYGIIPEIRTNWISIPLMYNMRSNEMGPGLGNLLFLLRILFLQSDGYAYSTIPYIGNHYIIMVPFLAYGLYIVFRRVMDKKDTGYSHEGLMAIWFTVGCLCAVLVHGERTNHLNWMQIPILYMVCVGVYEFASKSLKREKLVKILICVCGLAFVTSYVVTQSNTETTLFYKGYEEYVDWALENTEDDTPIYFTGARYSNLLYYLKPSPDEFAQNSIRDNFIYGNSTTVIHQHIKNYKNIVFRIDLEKIGEGTGIYIFPSKYREFMSIYNLTPFKTNGYYDLYIDADE